ncbi:putative bifunctional diguanylate cyclase/phosphodiesterase [Pleomorphomonas oryzae]|uniref:putative bifunctional diguanylate cyclase/phosphodiesterase n=1 Tax=Pleomorphomonas oryzae TaxID=261934 RepID=UPI00041E7F2B|nr:bifunctional diguanylate cyclase/phosphodiesterase [Pleomorphomonas oryzae]
MRPLRVGRATRDAAALIFVGILFFIGAEWLDLYERLAAFLGRHEFIQADELFIALLIVGILGFVFGYRRLHDLKVEVNHRRRAERDVSWIAAHDPLTRLPNRIGLKQQVERLKEDGKAGKPHMAMVIDIQGFKRINDVHGNEIGDEILAVVADRLRDIFIGCYLFRLGGDQFYAAQETPLTKDWEKLARRAIKQIAEPIEIVSRYYEVSAYVGMARYPDDAANIKYLLRCALSAVAAAKRERSKEPKWFDTAIDEATAKHAELDKQLRAALKSGDVRPYYQPMIDLTSGRIIGFEALARWRRSDGSFVSPTEFIPLAEETGMIGELSQILFTQACHDAAKWPRGIRLSFNVSPAQFSNRNFGRQMLDTLAATGLSPSQLEVEITESMFVNDVQLVAVLLDELREAGVHIAIDDFGTGYSSLSQLSRLRFDKLKIDRSFVSSFLDDARQAMIVRAMIGLGRGLGMKTIAEGIEEASQAETLQLLGCHQGQGFLFSRAVPAEQAISMLQTTWPVRPENKTATS